MFFRLDIGTLGVFLAKRDAVVLKRGINRLNCIVAEVGELQVFGDGRRFGIALLKGDDRLDVLDVLGQRAQFVSDCVLF